MRTNPRTLALALFTLAITCTLTSPALAQSAGGKTLPLPQNDKKILDQYLGKGVVGAPVAAPPITNPAKLYPLAAGTRTYKLTSGDDKGKTELHTITELKRNTPGTTWTESWGQGDALILNRDDAGNIYLITHNEHHEGLITQYSPPEPMVPKGMKPGETRTSKSDVKAFDLSKPDHLSHTGYLNLKFTYVGAYKVTVPAGSFDAVLLKWEYTGKIGPAKVNDVQYRFLAPGVGNVAEVEKKKVSAVLVYNDQQKIGKVLATKP